jgi:hypothetical protein
MKSIISLMIFAICGSAHGAEYTIGVKSEYGVITPSQDYFIIRCMPNTDIGFESQRNAKIMAVMPGSIIKIRTDGGQGRDINGNAFKAISGDTYKIVCR